MRGGIITIVSLLLTGECWCALSHLTTTIGEQCVRGVTLDTAQLCSLEQGKDDIIQPIQISSTWRRAALSRHSGRDRPWISPETGLVYTNDTPACTPYLDYLSDILCVYVYPEFHNNRGLAIFTTPNLAIEFSQRVHSISASLLDNPSNTLNVPSTHYTVAPLPNRGLGALALNTTAPSTLLTHTTPILLVHSDNNPTTFNRETHLRLAISLLPPKTRHAFHSLTRIYNNPSVSHQDITKANTFALDIAGTQHLALFPEPSRFNHDCSPNAMYHIDSLALTHTVHTTRPLQPSEEITISYLDPFSPATSRKSYLQSAFGFTCTCRRCAGPDADDAALAEIRRLEALLGNWDASSAAAPQGAVELHWYDYTDLAEELIALYEKLGLHGFMNTAYGHAALAYNSVGESGRAMMYARKALEVARLRHGRAGSRAVGVWEEFLEGGAWGHWSWRWRVKEG